jgi:nicotinamidase-related amidase
MKLLVVIDCQNDFIEGELGTPEAQAIVPNVKAKVKQYVENGDKVVYTRDTHTKDYLNTAEGKKLPVPHCIKFTKGWEIRPEVYTFGAPVIDKVTFGYDAWMHYLSYNDIIDVNEVESIEIVGLCTDICVISNAMILKAQFHETPIIVDSSCCAGVTPESHIRALEAMKMCQIEVL